MYFARNAISGYWQNEADWFVVAFSSRVDRDRYVRMERQRWRPVHAVRRADLCRFVLGAMPGGAVGVLALQ